jgi:hypothetical protein
MTGTFTVTKEEIPMITTGRSNHAVFAALALLLGGAVGCGQAPDASVTDDPETDVSTVEGAVSSTFIVRCPKLLTVVWSQAASGTGNSTISGDTVPFPRGTGPTTNPTCTLANPGSITLFRDITQGVDEIPATCRGKVTITGTGDQLSGTPGGPWNFRQPAVSTSWRIEPPKDGNPAHRNCHLEYALAPTNVVLKTSQACTAAGDTTFSCPNGTTPR